MRRAIAVLAAAGTLAGCAINPTQGPTRVERGPEPTYAAAREAVLAQMKVALKDPDSVKDFEMSQKAQPVSWMVGLINGGGHVEGWAFCVQYNAKNSYGAYVGLKRGPVAIRGFSDGTAQFWLDLSTVNSNASC